MHVTRMGKRRAFIIDNNNGDEWNDQKLTEQLQYIKLRVECIRIGNTLSYILRIRLILQLVPIRRLRKTKRRYSIIKADTEDKSENRIL